MVAYTRDDHVAVQPFTRQPDGEEVVIGLRERNVFLALPPEAVEILDQLASGLCVGEAQAAFAAAHGVTPDVGDLLSHLEAKGFVSRRGEEPAPERAGATRQAAAPAPGAPAVRYHLANIPEATARAFFAPAHLPIFLLVVASALAAVVADPSLLPGPQSLFFTTDRTLKFLVVTGLAYLTTYVHELFHLFAARAVGVRSRIGISNRLWVLVAETDLTGLWAAPAAKRYLPILAGPLSDLGSAALLVLVLYLRDARRLSLPGGLVDVLRAMIFVYLMRIVWQFFFFVRTDVYFLLVNFFRCKNLMGDTRAMVLNLLAKVLPWLRVTDQAHIPARERRVIAAYSVLWAAGQVLAFASLFWFLLPLLHSYFVNLSAALDRGYAANPYDFTDALTVNLVNALPLVAGLVLWLHSLWRRRST